MTPDQFTEAFADWLRAQTEEDHGPQQTWDGETKDRYYTKLGMVVLFSIHLKRQSQPAGT